MQRVDYLNFSLYQIKLFLVASEYRSFTTASQIFHATQSSVSKSIASMESVLGIKLFVREKNKLKLTDAGEFLFNEWKNILLNIESTINRAYLINDQGYISLTIGEPDSMKTDKDYLPSIKQFQKENRRIKLFFVEMPIGKLIGKLVSNELDVIFTIDYDVPTLDSLGIHWKTVAESPFLSISMHKSNPLASRESIKPEDIKNEEFIVMAPSEHPNYIDLLINLCKPYGFKPKIRVSSPNARSMMSTLLRSGVGVVLSNRFLYDYDSPYIKQFPLKNTYSRLIVAWIDRNNKSLVEKFIEKVTEKFPDACQ